MPWKKYINPYSPEKLLIPLPVPHPAHIAVTIYNRDTDDPIPLESEICQSILRGIEESHVPPYDNSELIFLYHLIVISMLVCTTKISLTRTCNSWLYRYYLCFCSYTN